jgi:hypothetical protein
MPLLATAHLSRVPSLPVLRTADGANAGTAAKGTRAPRPPPLEDLPSLPPLDLSPLSPLGPAFAPQDMDTQTSPTDSSSSGARTPTGAPMLSRRPPSSASDDPSPPSSRPETPIVFAHLDRSPGASEDEHPLSRSRPPPSPVRTRSLNDLMTFGLTEQRPRSPSASMLSPVSPDVALSPAIDVPSPQVAHADLTSPVPNAPRDP